MDTVLEQGVFGTYGYFFIDLVLQMGIAIVLPVVGVGPVSLCGAEIEIAEVIKFFIRATDAIVGIKKAVATCGLLGIKFKYFVFRSLLDQIVDSAAELRAELQRCSPAYHLYTLDGFQRREEIGFIIPKYISRDIIA